MRKATLVENKNQINIKLRPDTMDILQKVQGFGMLTGKKESQSDLIDRLLRAEYARIEQELAKGLVPA